eukprot:TRINITY_DN4223_c0_g1_i9.p1 TRINITY_DN4223_c0_g1~~TRINITY_DN4223_c0_g1_i9.p1  ORF type:complete len:296 (+),score=82.92 TRINITY_DN4223_c0_g1_i9:70-957(+)
MGNSSGALNLHVVNRKEVVRRFQKTLAANSSAGLAAAAVRLPVTAKRIPNRGDEKTSKIDFIEEDIDAMGKRFLSVNSPPSRAVYLLMKLLRDTITDGAYLSPALYLSRKVWLQSGAKYHAYQQKKENFELLQASLARIIQFDTFRADELKNALVEFCIELEHIQNNLCAHLSYISEVKRSSKNQKSWGDSVMRIGHSLVKRATRAASTIQKVDDSSDYINLIREICQQSTIIEGWIVHFEGKTAHEPLAETVITLLQRVTDFFQAVFCSVVIRDMKSVLARYVKHCTRSLIGTS